MQISFYSFLIQSADFALLFLASVPVCDAHLNNDVREKKMAMCLYGPWQHRLLDSAGDSRHQLHNHGYYFHPELHRKYFIILLTFDNYNRKYRYLNYYQAQFLFPKNTMLLQSCLDTCCGTSWSTQEVIIFSPKSDLRRPNCLHVFILHFSHSHPILESISVLCVNRWEGLNEGIYLKLHVPAQKMTIMLWKRCYPLAAGSDKQTQG